MRRSEREKEEMTAHMAKLYEQERKLRDKQMADMMENFQRQQAEMLTRISKMTQENSLQLEKEKAAAR